MSATKIWFNRWFSTAYNIIDLIKNNKDNKEFEIFVSHPNKYSLNLQNADNAFIEPKLSDTDYIEYLLEMCKKYNINVLLPYHKLLLIAKNVDKFNDLGTKVLVSENVQLLELINNKVLFYDNIKPKNIIKIPEYYMVSTKDEFIKAYYKLKEKGSVCFKPVIGVGGVGYRIIKESKNNIKDILNSQPSYSINLDEMLELLPQDDVFQSIIIMEYLDGHEYSIDCLADKNGNLITAIPRKKIDKYNRYLENNIELINLANAISKNYKIPYVYNIQVIYKNNEPNLLEINTRMAAGVYYSCMSGVNIPYEAINILLDKNINLPDLNLDLKLDLKLDLMIGNIDTGILERMIK